MKRKFKIPGLSLGLLLASFAITNNGVSQCNQATNYPNPAGWVQNGVGYNIGPAAFNFNATPCAAYNYATFNLGCTLNNTSWCAEVDFFYGARGTVGVAHSLLSFTENALNSWNVPPGVATISNNDMIEAYINCPPNSPAGSEEIFARSKDGVLWNVPSIGIPVFTNTQYFLRLQRLSQTQGMVSVFLDPARTIHAAGSPRCFAIVATVTNLSILQHGAIPQGAAGRDLTGTLQNMTVNDIVPGISGMPVSACPKQRLIFCINPICGAASYTWAVPSGTNIISGQGTTCISVTAGNTTGPVTCTTAFPAPGCNLVQSATLNIPMLPVTASASPDSICLGQSSTLTAGGATSYSWNPGSLSGSPVVVTPTVTTTYTVTGSGPGGCTNTASVTVTINPLPIANGGPPVNTCCGALTYIGGSGGSASGGTPPYTYSWSPTTNIIGCTTCPTAQVSDCSFVTFPITYTLTVTDANGCTDTATVLVNFNSCRLANPNAGQSNTNLSATDIMSVMPNPTNGNISISFLAPDLVHDVEIVGLLGQVIYRKTEISSPSLQIDLSDQPKGVYFVKCKEGDQVFVQRIVLQ